MLIYRGSKRSAAGLPAAHRYVLITLQIYEPIPGHGKSRKLIILDSGPGKSFMDFLFKSLVFDLIFVLFYSTPGTNDDCCF